jgi:hypothetical protein
MAAEKLDPAVIKTALIMVAPDSGTCCAGTRTTYCW